MKRLVTMLVVAVLVVGAGVPAQAQFVVFDPTNYAQNLKQVAHMLAQLRRMQDQLETARRQWETAQGQLQAMTGSRGMGNIVTEVSRQYIPRSWQETLNAAGELRHLAEDIRASAGYLQEADLDGLNDAYADALRQSGDAAVNAVAGSAMVFQQSGDRFERLEVLMDRIETASDDKAIQDLQARIQVEQVMLQNELIRAQAMNAMVEQRRRIENERQKQQAMAESFDF